MKNYLHFAIGVSLQTRKRLRRFKYENDFETYDATINHLIDSRERTADGS